MNRLLEVQARKKASQGFFITGTDTNCGKTWVTRLLIQGLQSKGKKVLALKPLASGTNAQGLNEDVQALASATQMPPHKINFFCFKDPIAPSIAAQMENRELNATAIWQACQPILQEPVDVVLVEGIGGVYVPLNEHETMLDFVKKLNLPVIFVVGLKLGCLNHALLSYQALLNAQVKIAGWVANQIDPDMEVMLENVETLKNLLKAPCLGVLPFSTPPDKDAQSRLLDYGVLNL